LGLERAPTFLVKEPIEREENTHAAGGKTRREKNNLKAWVKKRQDQQIRSNARANSGLKRHSRVMNIIAIWEILKVYLNGRDFL